MTDAEKVLNKVCETIGHHHIKIVQTGCPPHLVDIAKWVWDKPRAGFGFEVASLDSQAQFKLHTILEHNRLAPFCVFHTQDPCKFLRAKSWLDVVFIHADGLADGFEQFNLAASAGAHTIAFSDYQGQGALAIRKARQIGWKFHQEGIYSVLTRA